MELFKWNTIMNCATGCVDQYCTHTTVNIAESHS